MSKADDRRRKEQRDRTRRWRARLESERKGETAPVWATRRKQGGRTHPGTHLPSRPPPIPSSTDGLPQVGSETTTLHLMSNQIANILLSEIAQRQDSVRLVQTLDKLEALQARIGSVLSWSEFERKLTRLVEATLPLLEAKHVDRWLQQMRELMQSKDSS